MHLKIDTIDNRDSCTTWLHVNDGKDFIEVDPWSLVENVFENLNVSEAFFDSLKDLQVLVEAMTKS